MNDPLEATPPATETETENQSNGLALAATITGVVGLILSIIPVVGLLSWILCPAAIIMGFLAFGKPVGKGLAMTGIGTGVVGLAICILWVTVLAAAGSAISNLAGEEDINAEEILDNISYAPSTPADIAPVKRS